MSVLSPQNIHPIESKEIHIVGSLYLYCIKLPYNCMFHHNNKNKGSRGRQKKWHGDIVTFWNVVPALHERAVMPYVYLYFMSLVSMLMYVWLFFVFKSHMYVPMYLYWHSSHIGLCLYVPMFLCPYVLMSDIAYVPISICLTWLMLPCPYVRHSLCSYIHHRLCPYVRHSFCPYVPLPLCQT